MNNVPGHSVYQSTVAYPDPMRERRAAPFSNRWVGVLNRINCFCCRTDSTELICAADRLVHRLKSFPAIKVAIIDLLYLTDTLIDGDINTFDDDLNEALWKFKEAISTTPATERARASKPMSDKSLKVRLQFEHGIREVIERIINLIEPAQSRTNYALVVPGLDAYKKQICDAICDLQSSCIKSARQKKRTFEISARYKPSQAK